MQLNKPFHYIITLLSAAVLTGTSCKKSFLETTPTNKISDETAFSSVENAELALNGIYRLLYSRYESSQACDGQGAVMINLDFMGEDIVHTAAGTTYFRNAYKWADHRNQESTLVAFVYDYYYKVIANANMIILNIDALEGEESQKNRIKGEALVLRAWAHFNLVQIYGERYDATRENTQLGVPLMTITSTDGQARATVEEVYTQVIKDLDEAIEDFQAAELRTGTPLKTHINLYSAKGVKARVALTMQDYATAAQLASEAKGSYSLMTNTQYMAGFTDCSNSEWMWAVNQLADQLSTYGTFYAYMAANFYSSSHTKANAKCINKNLYSKLTSTDIRKKLWDSTGKNTDFYLVNGGTRRAYMHRKYMLADVNSMVGDIPFMRVAEMYLIEAEAYARAGNNTAAQDALYPLAVNRDPSYVKSTKTGDALIDEIMVQRRTELWGEGFRFLDLKRTNSALDRQNSNHTATLASILYVAAGDKTWQWLFPLSELNADKLLEQNPL